MRESDLRITCSIRQVNQSESVYERLLKPESDGVTESDDIHIHEIM